MHTHQDTDGISFYCLCSDMTFEEVAQKADNGVTFTELIDKYTDCQRGCGSCIEKLRDYLKSRGIRVE
jgi:bacterioferritin-associated ferredoxin